jgi:Flp pilus assembly protein TadG
MNKYSKFTKRGQTMVEFAFVLPVFLFLIMVIFDFGRAVYYYSAIHNAAREGARYGVIHPSNADVPNIIAKAKQYAIGLGVSSLSVTVDNSGNEYVGGMNNPVIKVTVEYNFRPVTPYVAKLLCECGYLRLSSDAVMRTEAMP